MMEAKRGATLVEVMLAGAIITLLSLALFSGISVTTRNAHENAELLSAEAVVWDAVWAKFNEEYSTIKSVAKPPSEAVWVDVALSSNAAPSLAAYGYDAANRPNLRIRVSEVEGTALCCIEGDLTWGPAGKRRQLSDVCPIFVYRGERGRMVSW